MMYLIALVIPPLAILLSGKPFQAVFNAVLWVGSLMFILLPFIAGQAGWGIAVIWAMAVVHNRRSAARDRQLVQDALRQQRP